MARNQKVMAWLLACGRSAKAGAEQCMQQVIQPNPTFHGGRVASDAYRATIAMADQFAGLEEGADRYGLLLLVKKLGKHAGFTPRMICLLDYYLAFTRDVDWEEGSRPIVYQSLSRTALDLGVSERQVQKLEKALFEAGAIGWHDSGNHRRFGQRCPESGRLLWAYGVELTPLAYLRSELEAKLAEKQAYDDAWMKNKREISHCRRQLRAHLAEWAEEGSETQVANFTERCDAIGVQLRSHLDLNAMRSLLSQHRSLLSELVEAMGVQHHGNNKPLQRAAMVIETAKGSPTSEPRFADYKSTTQPSKEGGSRADHGLQESVAAGSEEGRRLSCSGLSHVTLTMATAACGPRLSAGLPTDPAWADLVEAAYALRRELGISQASWAEACSVLGRNGAAVCLLVVDRAASRAEDPVRCPAAYFRGMVYRARRGELQLHRSLFGWLERDRRPLTAEHSPSHATQ